MKSKYLILFSILLFIFSCQKQAEQIEAGNDEAQILEIEQIRKDAFLSNDGMKMINLPRAEDSYAIVNGKITKGLTAEDSLRIKNMFEKMNYKEAIELSPTVVKISDDSTMAYAITHTRYNYTYTPKDKPARDFSFIDASLIVYEKQNGKWVIAAHSGTYKKPEDTSK